MMGKIVWGIVAVLAAVSIGQIASVRGEPVNSLWLVTASAGCYLIGFRFYARFIAAKVMLLDDKRATPAERLRNGHDYEPTNKWILFGHHFAAIAGPGPLVGPTLAAQFGYLPGTLWIIIGAVLGGAVQDFVILFCSMRRDGKSLGQMARDEIGTLGGFTALVTVLLIMIILLAVVGLVVVNALRESAWGTFTIVATMPIAVFMGLYLRYLRPGRVMEVSAIGFRAGDGEHLRRPVCFAQSVTRTSVYALRYCAGRRGYHLRVSGQCSSGVAAAGTPRLPQHLRQAWRCADVGCWDFIRPARPAVAAHSPDSPTGAVRFSPAKYSRFASSRSRVVPSQDSTR